MKNLFQRAFLYAVFIAVCVCDALGVTSDPPTLISNRQMRRQGGAVVLVNSAPIANMVAVPVVLNKANVARARVLQARGLVTVTNGDSIASIYRCCRIKSNDMIDRVELLNTTCGAACTGDIGLYQTTPNGAAVVSVAFFGSAIDLNTAHLAPLDVTLEAAAGPAVVTNCEKRVWEALGLTVDPQIEYDVAITLVAAAAATGTCVLKVNVVGAD